MVQENVVFGVEISFDEIDKCNNQFYKSYFKLPTKNLSWLRTIVRRGWVATKANPWVGPTSAGTLSTPPSLPPSTRPWLPPQWEVMLGTLLLAMLLGTGQVGALFRWYFTPTGQVGSGEVDHEVVDQLHHAKRLVPSSLATTCAQARRAWSCSPCSLVAQGGLQHWSPLRPGVHRLHGAVWSLCPSSSELLTCRSLSTRWRKGTWWGGPRPWCFLNMLLDTLLLAVLLLTNPLGRWKAYSSEFQRYSLFIAQVGSAKVEPEVAKRLEKLVVEANRLVSSFSLSMTCWNPISLPTGTARGAHWDSSAGYRGRDQPDWALHCSQYGVYHVWPTFLRGERGRVSSVWEEEEEVYRAWGPILNRSAFLGLFFWQLLLYCHDTKCSNYDFNALVSAISPSTDDLMSAFCWWNKSKGSWNDIQTQNSAYNTFFTANIFWNGIKYTIHFTTIGLYSEQDNIWTCKNISQQISMHQKSNLFPQHISMHKKTNL